MNTWQEYNFHQWLRKLDQASRWAPPPAPDTVSFGRAVEVLAGEVLRGRGHTVLLTGHQAHWDLWADGARVEVKASRFGGRRWQWHMRGSRADVYVLACVRGQRVIAWYVVPGEALGDRRHLEIWNADPASYAGQWSGYLGAWRFVDQAASGTCVPWQLGLWS